MKKQTKILFTKHGIYRVKKVCHDNGHTIFTYQELRSSELYKKVKQDIRLKISKTARFEKMKAEVYQYMKEECSTSWHPSYMKYFDEWFNNCTEYQIKCFSVWMKGKMGPFNF